MPVPQILAILLTGLFIAGLTILALRKEGPATAAGVFVGSMTTLFAMFQVLP